MAALAAALDGLSQRIAKTENAMHQPPCRGLDIITTRIERLEDWRGRTDNEKKETRGRISNLAWSLITHILIAGLATFGTLLALGYKSWILQLQ